MPNARQQFLSLLNSQHDGLLEDFAALADRIRVLLLNADDSDGRIPPSRWRVLEQEIGALVLAYFLSLANNRAFIVGRDGSLTPQTPFMRRLWAGVEASAELAVARQAQIMRVGLRGREDLLRQLERARVYPPLLTSDAFHEAVLGARTLADRVLFAAAETRRKVTLLLREQLAEQRRSAAIADTMTRFLTSKLNVTHKPYGTTALYDAQRLQHGELTRAYGQLGLTAAAQNPFVTSVDWVTSARHKDIDLCDLNAAGSPYAVEDVPPYPGHGNCMCYLRYRVTGWNSAVAERLADTDVLNTRGALSPGFADWVLRGGGSA